MILKFGLELGEKAFPALQDETTYCDEFSILSLLEKMLGIGSPDNLDFLRVEQYRQALKQYLLQNKHAFYSKSYEADSLATAAALLQRRDELKLAGFKFKIDANVEKRIVVFTALEKMLHLLPHPFYSGYADRFEYLLDYIEIQHLTLIKEIHLNEPFDLLPVHIQRLFSILSKQGCNISESQFQHHANDSDLDQFKSTLLTNSKNKFEAKADGSIIIMKCSSDSYAAAYLSKLIAENPTHKPLCILPDKNRALDMPLFRKDCQVLASYRLLYRDQPYKF
jgi:hypothetical protein